MSAMENLGESEILLDFSNILVSDADGPVVIASEPCMPAVEWL